MAYSAPELLLVGAAQNLVLGGSHTSDDKSNSASDCWLREQEDSQPANVYDGLGLW